MSLNLMLLGTGSPMPITRTRWARHAHLGPVGTNAGVNHILASSQLDTTANPTTEVVTTVAPDAH